MFLQKKLLLIPLAFWPKPNSKHSKMNSIETGEDSTTVITRESKLEIDNSNLKSVTAMLVTTLCWRLYDGDWFQMLMAESLCWRLFSLCWRISQCIKSVTNILNRSPTSQTFHQHIWSPTSVTNIDATLGTSQIINIIAI